MKGKIFNAQEVQSILNKSKVMFREVIKPCKQHPKCLCIKERNCHISIDFKEDGLFWRPIGGEPLQPFPFVNGKLSDSVSLDKYSPYQVGQNIFCKEIFSTDWVNYDDTWGESCVGDISYKSTWEKDKGDFDEPDWKPAQHMKQEHSRLTLQIKSIGVERLADITPFDCVCEGVWDGRNVMLGMSGKAVEAFKDNWNATHKKPEEKWEASPWVWKVEMEVVR